MASTAGTQIPKPANEQDFESNCLILWQCILDDPNVFKVGRRGQAQNGVDLRGYRKQNVRKPVGIQCKLKSERTKLTETEVREEFRKALGFKPALTEYFILTTAPDDNDLQVLADELAVEQADNGRDILFYVWGWGTISEKVAQFPEAMRAFDPSYGVYSAEIRTEISEVRTVQDLTRGEMASGLMQVGNDLRESSKQILAAIAESTQGSVAAVEVQLDAEIDGYRTIANDGKAITALAQFQRLLDRVEGTASGRILFRIKANIANCLLASGKSEEAVALLLEAHSHAPTEPKAIANKAFALLLQGDYSGVLAMGRENMLSRAADEHLSAHVVQAARFDDTIDDPLSLIPESDRETPGVLNSLAHFYRHRLSLKWRSIAVNAGIRFPDDPFAKRLSAEAVIDAICEDKEYLHSGRLTERQRIDLEQAISKLSDVWKRIRTAEGEVDDADSAVCCNLLLAYRISGDRKSAMELVREGIPLFGNDSAFILRAAGAAFETGDPIIDELLPKLVDGPDKTLMVFQTAVASNDWQTLSAIDPLTLEAVPQSERRICDLALRFAKLALSPPADLETALKDLVRDASDDPRLSILVAQYCDTLKMDGLAEEAWRNAINAVNDTTHHSGRIMTATYAARKGHWSDAADILDGRIDENRDSEELRSLALGLVNERPTRERATAFFHRLPTEIRSKPFYMRAEGRMYFNYGALSQAEELTRRLLDTKPDIDAVLTLIVLLKRQDRASEIAAALSIDKLLTMPGEPGEMLDIAHELSRVGRGDEALKYAYDVLRSNPNNAEVARKYAILILGSEDRISIPSSPVVALDTWVRLSRQDHRGFAFIIENGEDDPTGGYVSPRHPLASLSIGKQVGETFSEERALGDQPVWKIEEIKHKYLHALHDIMENYQTRFPDAGGLYAFTTKGDDVGPILDQIKSHGESERARADLYLKHHVPFHMVARKFERSPIAFADYLRAIGEKIRSCVGQDLEQSQAQEIIEEYRGRGAVLDTYAAWTAASMDIFDVLKETFGSLYISQSVFDDLVVLKGGDDFSEREFSLSWRGGEFYRDELTRERFAEWQDYIRAQRDKIEVNCIVEAVTAPNQRNAIAEVFIANFGSNVMDAAVLANRGHVLLSEDMYFRQIAANAWSVPGVWLQSVLVGSVSTGALTTERYVAKTVDLGRLRHGHLTVNGPLFAELIALAKDDTLQDFEAAADFIGTPDADIVAHAEVVINFTKIARARSGRRPGLIVSALGLLLEKLIRHGPENWSFTVALVYNSVGTTERSYILDWVKGHFLPVDDMLLAARSLNMYGVRYTIAQILSSESTVEVVRRHRRRRRSNMVIVAPQAPPYVAPPRLSPPKHRRGKRKGR
ncbi:tetratricopeptide repeat protein [Ensifer sesbaniae]|uniref:tetratricopeptide repeat protein n=1 Tax=Ensifer sesbaniae TaxID=1214071 RepID=UPI001567D514|nr:hypothetical protein [Ensifer sesbaniae]NRQ18979.1 Beta-barrel assembly-enhancing protease [Ensifer sesbaniae]